MGLFELLFGLAAIILGLALTNITASLHRLALAGRKVRWAPEPLLLALLVTMIIVYVWLGHWFERKMTSINAGRALLDVARMMALYFAAASCLPEPDQLGEKRIDLVDYYYGSRALSYGALITGLILFDIYFALGDRPMNWHETLRDDGGLVLVYGSLIFIRARWVHLVALSVVILVFGSSVFALTLKQVQG